MSEQNQNNDRTYLVTETLLNNILAYLANRPFRESADLIGAIRMEVSKLNSLPPAVEGQVLDESKAPAA